MRWFEAVPALALLVLCAAGARAELKLIDQPMWVFPDQTFRICLEQPPGSGVPTVKHPDTLEAVDQWDQDGIQRYYFRALRPGDATLRFSGQGGELTYELEVLPWSDILRPRAYGNTALPRVWPVAAEGDAELKTRRTLHSAADLRALRAGGAVGSSARRWRETTDEDIFRIIPGPCVPRTCLMALSFEGIGKGCPVCGTAIYEGRSGFYPWVFDAEKHPWKVGCPNCDTWFPSNDFHLGDMHSGDFPDDGFGCEPVKPVLDNNGNPWRFPFIAYYHEWEAYMRGFTPGFTECARAYAATGDQVYAHKAAVGLFRFAESMLDLSVNLNHRKMALRDAILKGPVGAPRIRGLGGSFLYIQPNWDTPRMEDAARAWDLVFDALEGDDELLRFCQAHSHPEIRTLDDFRRFVEAGAIRVPLQACLDGAIARNYPMQEVTAATMAMALGTPRTIEIADWLLNTSGIRFALTNEFYQDGGAYESESYNRIQIHDMVRLLQTLEDFAALHPDAYQPPRFVSPLQDPKFRTLFDFCLDYSLIGRTTPTTGDTGSCASTTPLVEQQGYPCGLGDWVTAYKATQDPRFLQAMYGPGGSLAEKLGDPELQAQAVRVGQARGWQVAAESNILDGYGYAILRSGQGDHQRALWARYARCLQHTHPDMLTFGFEAMQRKLLPELGYPIGWTYANHWETNWGTHYGAKIVGARSWDFSQGELTTFVPAAPCQIAEVETAQTVRGETMTRTRLLALVDLSAEDCYAISLERVRGGTEQYWTFHGPDGEAATEGLDLQPYEGTVLGPGLKYGDFSTASDPELSCFAFMREPAAAGPEAPWSLDYLLRNQENVHLRLTALLPARTEVTLAKAKAPGGKCNYDLTFAVQRQQGEGQLAQQYLNVLEPYTGTRIIRRVERLEVTGGAANAAFPPVALRVTAGDLVDTIIIQAVPGTAVTAGGVTCDGQLGFWREREGKPVTATLVRGASLSRGETVVKLAAAEYRGEIAACDWAASAITISPAPPAIEALVGRHVRLTNPAGSSASYQVEQAEPVAGGCRLTFRLDPRLGEGFVAGCADGRVNSGTGLRKAAYGYYAGKTLATEDGRVSYRLAEVAKGPGCLIDEGTHGKVAAATLQQEFVDRDGDGLVRFVIYDYGVGDAVTIENHAVVRWE